MINTFENFYNNNESDQLDVDFSSNSYVGGLKGNSANEIFNFQNYVQNVRENQPFFERFVRTQAFINFIEQAHTSTDALAQSQGANREGQVSEPHLAFFKECTRKLS